MRKRRFYKTLILSLLIMSFLMNAGMDFLNDPMELNPKERIIYQTGDVETVTGSIQAGNKDPWFAVSGIIKDIGDKYDRFSLTSRDGKTVIECDTKETRVKNEVAELYSGDSVIIYGSVKKKLLGGGFKADVKVLEVRDLKTGEDVYVIPGEREYDSTGTTLCRIENPRSKEKDIVTYRIPSEWKTVERVLDDKGDHIYGCQYRINRLYGSSVPESLYVFYFDYNKNLTDKSRYDDTAKIEAAIVKNILKKDDAGKCPESVIVSPYGTEYHYYDDKYESGSDIYHLEFVFRENNEKGMLVYMYIYRMPDHADDVMYVMRTTEIETEAP